VQAMGGVDSRVGCRWFIWCGGSRCVGSAHFVGVIQHLRMIICVEWAGRLGLAALDGGMAWR